MLADLGLELWLGPCGGLHFVGPDIKINFITSRYKYKFVQLFETMLWHGHILLFINITFEKIIQKYQKSFLHKDIN